jgi:hypothetical protein
MSNEEVCPLCIYWHYVPTTSVPGTFVACGVHDLEQIARLSSLQIDPDPRLKQLQTHDLRLQGCPNTADMSRLKVPASTKCLIENVKCTKLPLGGFIGQNHGSSVAQAKHGCEVNPDLYKPRQAIYQEILREPIHIVTSS